MSCDNWAVRVRDVEKTYFIYPTPFDRIKQLILPRLRRFLGRGRRNYYTEFCALSGVSFDVAKGEAFAIIGRNGAGKSTLLQMICQTTYQTAGSIEVRGKVAALLELGTGFNPEFTGRENVFLNASLHGLEREVVEGRINKIIEFAEIGDFIDRPVKTYSSGMLVRLAFSVIVHIDAEILVIDEALAVGDVFFQQKCMRFLREFRSQGGTILFVSHDTASVTALCERAILLSRDDGVCSVKTGSANDICKHYLSFVYEARKVAPGRVENSVPDLSSSWTGEIGERRYEHPELQGVKYQVSSFLDKSESIGDGGGRIENVYFEREDGGRSASLESGQRTTLVIEAVASVLVLEPAFGFIIKDRLGQYVITEGTSQAFSGQSMSVQKNGRVRVEFQFDMPILIQGEYTVTVAFADGEGSNHSQLHYIHEALLLTATGSRLVHGMCGVQNSAMKILITDSTRT